MNANKVRRQAPPPLRLNANGGYPDSNPQLETASKKRVFSDSLEELAQESKRRRPNQPDPKGAKRRNSDPVRVVASASALDETPALVDNKASACRRARQPIDLYNKFGDPVSIPVESPFGDSPVSSLRPVSPQA